MPSEDDAKRTAEELEAAARPPPKKRGNARTGQLLPEAYWTRKRWINCHPRGMIPGGGEESSGRGSYWK
jgi:hypothetical protein